MPNSCLQQARSEAGRWGVGGGEVILLLHIIKLLYFRHPSGTRFFFFFFFFFPCLAFYSKWKHRFLLDNIKTHLFCFSVSMPVLNIYRKINLMAKKWV